MIWSELVKTCSVIASAVRTRYQATPLERACAARLEKKNVVKGGTAAAPLIAVEAVEELFYFNLFGEIVCALRALGPLRVAQLPTRSFGISASTSLRKFLSSRLHINALSDAKWRRLYTSFCDQMAFAAAALKSPHAEISTLRRAMKLLRSVKSKNDLATLKSDGILLGDLVIDSYLRFKPAVEIDLGDPYLLVVVRQALKDIDSALSYFRTAKPSAYLTSYVTYVQHGIPARAALALKIKVFTFGNMVEFGTCITDDHLCHTKRVSVYNEEFSALPSHGDKIALAGKYFEKRFAGVLDTATSYMRSSAYTEKSQDVPDVKGATVVFLHDFYDSVHVYRWMIFHDFWDWVCATVEILRESGRPFFIKPHPNQGAESSDELSRLRAKYPGLKFISTDITNKQLVDAGMACAVTIYGTVASEMAYLGIPTIACGDNPHVSFTSFHLAKSLAEYRSMLLTVPELTPDSELLRQEACVFYYMHNLNMDIDEVSLVGKYCAARGFMNTLENNPSPDADKVGRIFDGLAEDSGFKQFITAFTTGFRQEPTRTDAVTTSGKTLGCSQIPQY